jgi:hypothetical protein
MEMITKRASNIPPFIVMDVLEKAQELERQGRHIIHLEVGEPDFPTPECICQAAVKALEEEQTHYTHSLGLIELREAICQYYLEKYGVLLPSLCYSLLSLNPGMRSSYPIPIILVIPTSPIFWVHNPSL